MDKVIKTPGGLLSFEHTVYLSQEQYDALTDEQKSSGQYCTSEDGSKTKAQRLNELSEDVDNIDLGDFIDDHISYGGNMWSSNKIATNISKAVDSMGDNLLSEDGFHNLRVVGNKKQSYNSETGEWEDITVSAGYHQINNYPQDMKSISINLDSEAKCIRLKWEEPDDTYYDGERICRVEGVKVVRKIGSAPSSIDDGKLIVDIKRADFGKYKDEWLCDYPVLYKDETYYYHFYPYFGEYINERYDNLVNVVSDKGHTVYAFHIDGNESDPYEKVTYLHSATGMTPAHMNYETGEFDYGDWEDIFFMPRPCMLKYDGTVDYYLDPNDYTKKEDGTVSDVTNISYGGNAMMEWGRDNKIIWYKVVSEGNYSATIYVSHEQVDKNYVAWSFMDANGNYADHFYTAIYEGVIYGKRLRSISGRSFSSHSIDPSSVLTYAGKNYGNDTDGKTYCGITISDNTLITILAILISKSTDSQTAFGMGHTYGSSYINTGLMDTKGMFWGENTGTGSGVKIFGMENYWGNLFKLEFGSVYMPAVNKMWSKSTYSTKDGSTISGYAIGNEIPYSKYKTITACYSVNFCKYMSFSNNLLLPLSAYGSESTNYCDWAYTYNSAAGTYRYVLNGGGMSETRGSKYHKGIFAKLITRNDISTAVSDISTYLTYRPIVSEE